MEMRTLIYLDQATLMIWQTYTLTSQPGQCLRCLKGPSILLLSSNMLNWTILGRYVLVQDSLPAAEPRLQRAWLEAQQLQLFKMELVSLTQLFSRQTRIASSCQRIFATESPCIRFNELLQLTVVVCGCPYCRCRRHNREHTQ